MSKFFQRQTNLSYVKSFRDQTLNLSPGEGRFVFGFFLRGGGMGDGIYMVFSEEADQLSLTGF